MIGWLEGRSGHFDLVSDFMFPEYIAFDHPGLTDMGNVGNALGHDAIAIVCFAVFGEEADKALSVELVDVIPRIRGKGLRRRRA